MKISRKDLALLALRLVLGAAFVFHGFPKIQHPTTWATHVLPGTPPFLAVVSAVAEFGGGIAILVGFGTQIAGFLIAANMVVAIFFVLVPHGAAFVSSAPGAPTFELPLIYLVAAFTLVLLGAGSVSVDALRSDRRNAGGRMGSRATARR
ncbi:MAG: DoxX family protein [Candidatus Eremiobacteraeota bacterium]|nr:DoxX family protein [Candidatus Eremiobacteraeota bacterium]